MHLVIKYMLYIQLQSTRFTSKYEVRIWAKPTSKCSLETHVSFCFVHVSTEGCWSRAGWEIAVFCQYWEVHVQGVQILSCFFFSGGGIFGVAAVSAETLWKLKWNAINKALVWSIHLWVGWIPCSYVNFHTFVSQITPTQSQQSLVVINRASFFPKAVVMNVLCTCCRVRAWEMAFSSNVRGCLPLKLCPSNCH